MGGGARMQEKKKAEGAESGQAWGLALLGSAIVQGHRDCARCAGESPRARRSRLPRTRFAEEWRSQTAAGAAPVPSASSKPRHTESLRRQTIPVYKGPPPTA